MGRIFTKKKRREISPDKDLFFTTCKFYDFWRVTWEGGVRKNMTKCDTRGRGRDFWYFLRTPLSDKLVFYRSADTSLPGYFFVIKWFLGSARLIKILGKIKSISCFASQGKILHLQPDLFLFIKFTRQAIYCCSTHFFYRQLDFQSEPGVANTWFCQVKSYKWWYTCCSVEALVRSLVYLIHDLIWNLLK